MPTIDLTDAEHAAVTVLIRRAVEEDHFPNAPRLDPLRSALAKLDPAAAQLRRPSAAKTDKPAPEQPKTPKGRPRSPERSAADMKWPRPHGHGRGRQP
jgi:hypothetical protein